jgi:K+/H+ antiporter YhaU regulatory subunit KhtT
LENWYVGKNAEAVYDRIKRHVREDDDTTSNRSDPDDSISSSQSQTGHSRSSGELTDTLVFKGKVSAERTIEIPEIELEAFGIEEGDYLQFYAEPISVESLREQDKQK